MQNGHFRLLFHTPDNSSYDEMVMNKYIAFVGTRASLIPNVSRRTWSAHCCSGHAFCFFFPSPWHLLSVFIFFFCCLGGCCSSPFAVAIVVFSMHRPHQESWSSHILLLSLEMVVLELLQLQLLCLYA